MTVSPSWHIWLGSTQPSRNIQPDCQTFPYKHRKCRVSKCCLNVKYIFLYPETSQTRVNLRGWAWGNIFSCILISLCMIWLCCQNPRLQGKWKGVLRWEPNHSWLFSWDVSDTRNIAQYELNLWSSADVLVNRFNICLPRSATGALRGLGYEAKGTCKLPHVWIQSCTQGGYTTREQLSMYTLREEVWL